MTAIRLGTWNLLHGIPVAPAGGSAEPSPGSADVQPTESAGPPAVTADGLVSGNLSPQRWRAWVDQMMSTAATQLSCDVVALQEVDRNSPRSGLVCHTSALAAAMSAHSAFCPTLRGVPGESWEPSTGLGDEHQGALYGVGLVSRHPVRRWHSQELPRSTGRLPLPIPSARGPRFMWVSDEPRWALAAEIESPHGDFTAITTHLSFIPGVNLRQLRALTTWAQTLPGPVFLLGDLNLPYRIARAQSRWQLLAAHPTYPLQTPRVQFDHIAVLRPTTVSAHTTMTYALPMGDHRALTAMVNLH